MSPFQNKINKKNMFIIHLKHQEWKKLTTILVYSVLHTNCNGTKLSRKLCSIAIFGSSDSMAVPLLIHTQFKKYSNEQNGYQRLKL